MTFHQLLANRPIKSRISGLPRPVLVNYLHMLSNHTSVVFPLLMFYVARRAPVASGLKGFCGYCSTPLHRCDAFDKWVFFQHLCAAINATLDHFNPTLHYTIMLAGAFVCTKFSCMASFPCFIIHRVLWNCGCVSMPQCCSHCCHGNHPKQCSCTINLPWLGM